ncbi:MAG: DEAD/DEAH box helicase [Anaerovoracaceae bacterium]
MGKEKTDLTLRRLKRTGFPSIYKNLIIHEEHADTDYHSMLSLAVILINSKDIYVQRLGYRMVVMYCNQTNDYQPLYEISINMGLYPISKFITLVDSAFSKEATLFTELNDAFIENFISDSNYLSFEQKRLSEFFLTNINATLAVVAPTSYGKTELILTLLESCENQNICIITPTKSLLAQTKLRIVHSDVKWVKKIITHPEMYNENDKSVVAVLTQERLLRLLRKDTNLAFNYVVIDEAHSLLNKGERDILLASVAIILEKRNPNVIFKFLTPFLNKANNLNIRFTNYPHRELRQFYANEYIKSERFYVYDTKKENGVLQLYDQFMNDFYTISSGVLLDEVSFVEENRLNKNIVYLNKPIDIENFSEKLAAVRTSNSSKKIEKACKDIAEYIHPNYNLINYLRKGIIYHHGSVPDAIRSYIEQLYSTIPEINYVVTSSTLLEGVNLPAERMFILDNKKGRGVLSPSSFKNLIGRVCRFGEIFNPQNENLQKLEPHIYIVNGKYCSSNANVYGFLQHSAKIDNKINDEPQNVLLEATPIDDTNNGRLKSSIEFIENYENNTVESYDYRYVQTEIGKSCFLNGINEMPVFQVENDLQRGVELLREEDVKINEPEQLMYTINNLFLEGIQQDEESLINQSIYRLRHEATRNFYCMFLNWRIKGASYAEMIKSFLSYWKSLISDGKETIVFVGRWGDTTRGGYQKLWTDIKNKSIDQRINLAIVRIKEEQDFLDNTIIKFIEVLNDFKFLEESFYNKIKYGTDDKQKIALVKNGLSLSLANLIVDRYQNFLEMDIDNSVVFLLNGILDEMENNSENQVLINEAAYYM